MADALDTIEGVLHMGYERVGDEIRDKDNVYLDAADCRVLAAAFAALAAELDADHGLRGGSDGGSDGCVPTTEEVRAMIAETWEVISDALAKVALPIAEHRDALAARADAAEAEVERLRKAMEMRCAAGHNDTCAAMLGDYACSCGHDDLLNAWGHR